MMNNIDYKLLRALSLVIEKQSFEAAANRLHISQSAISQRIKLLEEFIGHPVLVRAKPMVLTSIGKQLITHYHQVEQLEQELLPQILPEIPVKPARLSFAINADSLAIWFLKALSPLLKSHLVELNILITHESRTLDKLKLGEAFAAISLQATPLPGYKVDYLGKVDYILVASPEFQEKFFSNGVNKKSLKNAPGVVFDHQDDMHHQFIKQHFGLKPDEYPCHVVRSSEAFVDMAKQGLAYCMIPEPQITEELNNRKLIRLLVKKKLTEKLYWHSWILSKGIFKEASELIIHYAQNNFQ